MYTAAGVRTGSVATRTDTCMYVYLKRQKETKYRTAYVLETYDIVMLLNRLLKMSLLPKYTMVVFNSTAGTLNVFYRRAGRFD